jgi:hypothetical protein
VAGHGGRANASAWVIGFTASGKKVFDWELGDHFGEFPKTKMPAAEMRVNSILSIPQTSISKSFPAFNPGNLLLNFSNSELIVVIRHEDGKVVWTTVPRKPNGRDTVAVSDVRMLDYGRLVMIRGIYENIDPHSHLQYSSLDRFNPMENRIEWNRFASPSQKFFNADYGSLDVRQEHLLIAHAEAGSVFEMDLKGRLTWEWIHSRNDRFGLAEPILRASYFTPKQTHILKNWESAR